MPEQPFEEKDVLFRWKPEPKDLDHPSKWVDDEADEYAIVRLAEIPCGVMVYGIYRNGWEANSKTRPLIAELLRLAELLRQLHESREQHTELLAVAREYAIATGGIHDPDCPEDDTCNCSFRPLLDRLEAALAPQKGA